MSDVGPIKNVRMPNLMWFGKTVNFCIPLLNRGYSMVFTLPETNSSHLKMDGWNTNFLLGPGLFSGAMLVLGSVCEILGV